MKLVGLMLVVLMGACDVGWVPPRVPPDGGVDGAVTTSPTGAR